MVIDTFSSGEAEATRHAKEKCPLARLASSRQAVDHVGTIWSGRRDMKS